ncbi:MAG: hypothetical protein WC707_03560 [Candidatus Babeliaceae bacterium]|jgi:hypothetical protein
MNLIKIYAFFLLSITSYNFGMTGNINTSSSLTVLSEKESEKLFTRLNSSLPQSSQNIKPLGEISLARKYLKEPFNATKKQKRNYYYAIKKTYCNHPDCKEKGDNVYIGHSKRYKHYKAQHPTSSMFYCYAFNCPFKTDTRYNMASHTRIYHKNI